jgi:hypothetical protein
VEQNLLRRHPQVPAGVVVAAVGRTARRLLHGRAGRREVSWAEVELAADEQLLLRQALRAGEDGRPQP